MLCVWPISLSKTSANPDVYLGHLDGPSRNKNAEYYIEIKSKTSGDELTKLAPLLVRIACPDDITELLAPRKHDVLGYHGVHLTGNHTLTGGLPKREGFHYLRLIKKGPFWENVEISGRIVIAVLPAIHSEIVFMYGTRESD